VGLKSIPFLLRWPLDRLSDELSKRQTVQVPSSRRRWLLGSRGDCHDGREHLVAVQLLDKSDWDDPARQEVNTGARYGDDNSLEKDCDECAVQGCISRAGARGLGRQNYGLP